MVEESYDFARSFVGPCPERSRMDQDGNWGGGWARADGDGGEGGMGFSGGRIL